MASIRVLAVAAVGAGACVTRTIVTPPAMRIVEMKDGRVVTPAREPQAAHGGAI